VNETKWANPKFNELLVQAAQRDRRQRARRMYAEMQQLIHDDCGQIVIVFNNYVGASTKKLAHWRHRGEFGRATGSRSPSVVVRLTRL